VKLGTENKTKTVIAAVLVIVAAFTLYNWVFTNQDAETATAVATVAAPLAGGQKSTKPGARKVGNVVLAQSLDPTLRLDVLKSSEDVTYKGSGRDIFQSQPETAPIPKEVTKVIDPGPPPPPPPPPIPLKFYGFSGNKNGPKQVFLSKGEDIFIAREGQVIDRRYKIVKIGPNSVDVEDVLTNNRQTLPLAAS
jgi:hypothetical protein